MRLQVLLVVLAGGWVGCAGRSDPTPPAVADPASPAVADPASPAVADPASPAVADPASPTVADPAPAVTEKTTPPAREHADASSAAIEGHGDVVIEPGHNSRTHGHGGPPALISRVSFVVTNNGKRSVTVSIVEVRWQIGFEPPLRRKPRPMRSTIAAGASQDIEVVFEGVQADSFSSHTVHAPFDVAGRRRTVKAPYIIYRRTPSRE